MKPRCRLCDRRTVEDSIFCAQHRDQAQRFSLSFGKQEAGAESPPDAPDEAPPADESSFDSSPPEASPADTPAPAKQATADAQPSTPVAATPPAELDQERAVLAAAFHPAFDELRTRLKEDADPERWPQLSLYFLEDALHCRAYFSIVPRTDGEPAPQMYALYEDRLHVALAAGGAVFEELYARYSEKTEALQHQTIQTLDVHFLSYAGLIAINSHPPTGKPQNLVTLKLDGDLFRKVEFDDDVRALMRHDHW